MSYKKYIQKYESDGQGSVVLISKEELIEKVQETITLSVEEQEIVEASIAFQATLNESTGE